MLGVETFGIGLGQLNHLGSNNAQTSLLETGQDLTNDVFGDGIGLDDGQGTFNGHKTLQRGSYRIELQKMVNLRIIRRLKTNR